MSRSLICAVGAILSFFTIASIETEAQDNNYWTYAYGTRSALLGGAVIAGVRDTSAGFYNPAALGFIDNPSLSVSANAYRYESISVNDGAGDGENLNSAQFNVVPTLISGLYRFNDSPEHTIGYEIITRNRSTTSFTARRDDVADVLQNPFTPGFEDYIGQFNFDTDLTEVWAGLSYAYKGWERVSVGITNFVAVRTQKLNATVQARAINRTDFIAGITDATTHYDYYNLRALWKAGIAADLDSLKVGFTVTSPSVGLTSSGTVSRDVTVVNVDVDGNGYPDSFVADDRQDSLDAEFKSPASIGWGLEYALSERTNVAAAAEWFGAIGRYNVIEPKSQDFLRPTGLGLELFDSKDFLAVTTAAQSVLNWVVGVEHDFNDKDRAYLSVRSDYSSAKLGPKNAIDLGFSNLDLYHATIGASHVFEHSEIGFGLVYTYGHKNNLTQPVNFTNASESNLLLGQSGSVAADYSAIGAILGYTYFFS